MPDSETQNVEVSRQVWTAPNLISFLRIVSIPVIAWLIGSNHLVWSLIIMAISGMSDGIDGYVVSYLVTRNHSQGNGLYLHKSLCVYLGS